MGMKFNSVCMATYNGEKFIKEQIESILSQIGIADELIITDDGSTDHTVDIVKSFKDSRIKLFTGNQFKDPIKNFQFALEQSNGECIFLSDQDDVWLENKYDLMLSQLQKYDLVISDSQIVDDELNLIHPSFFDYFKSKKGLIKNIIKSSYYGSCMAFKRRVLEAALPFPDTKEIGHDLWLGLVAELKYSVLFFKVPLIKYRRHGGAFTPVEVGRSKRSFYQMVLGRFIMIKWVLKFALFNKYQSK